jgi:hypothetical protein
MWSWLEPVAGVVLIAIVGHVILSAIVRGRS